MSAIIKTLKTKTDETEQSVYPRTVLEAVIDPDTNESLDVILSNLEIGGSGEPINGSAYVDFDEPSTDVPGDVENVTSATLVSYDNSTSGLEASSVQEAVDEVASRTKWKLHGHYDSNTHIAQLPSSFEELYIAITDGYSSRTYAVNAVHHHIDTILDEYNLEYLLTFGFASSLDNTTGWYGGGCLKLTKTTIQLLDYSFRGTNHAEDVKWLVYYR